MLSPLSTPLEASSPAAGSDAIAFMSGSLEAGGITSTGSSPGCQRSMGSRAPPSELLPKKRLAVCTEKPSCEVARSNGAVSAPGGLLRSWRGWISSEGEASYCGSGGEFIAAASSGSSGAGPIGDAALALFAPTTDGLDI